MAPKFTIVTSRPVRPKGRFCIRGLRRGDSWSAAASAAEGSRWLGLYLDDVGITMALTGQKSSRRLVPVVGFGLGIASAGGATRDSSGYRFGSPFAISGTAGLRYVPGSNV